MIFKNNKKANMTYQEIILILVSLVIVAITLFVISFTSTNASGKLTDVNLEISYKFPAAYIQLFLYQRVSDENIKSLKLDDTKEYFVKDIIQMKKSESKDIISNMRDDFIKKEIKDYNADKDSNSKNQHILFQKFSNSNYDINDLIQINYYTQIQFNELNLNLDYAIKNKNYYYYYYNLDENFVVVSFMKYSSITDTNSNWDIGAGGH